jgi:ABC-type sulfate/molybdate transport systems ATPase subunit
VLALDIEVFRRQLVVAVALDVGPGERFALFGPSGAGKTTVLETVAGLVEPSRGSVVLDGRVLWSERGPRVPYWDREVALVRQDPAVFPHLSVRDNLVYTGSRADRSALERLVAALDLGSLLDARPSSLSGGQARRVALARALAAPYRAVLLDEPYTGLDATLRRTVTGLVADEASARGAPVVLVSHELAESQAFADRVGVIDGGRLLQVAAPREVVLRPASRRVAELVGYRGFVPHAGGILGIHPERVRLGSQAAAGVVLSGTVTGCRPAGAGFEVDVAVGRAELTCRLDREPGVPGSEVEVTAVDPPTFGPDGRLIVRTAVPRP